MIDPSFPFGAAVAVGSLDERMTQSMTLAVTHPARKPGFIDGFRFIWAYYIDGFNANTHCQPCFKRKLVKDFKTGTASTDKTVVFDEIERYKYVYVCGVAAGPKEERTKNFHFPLRFERNANAARTTYNGYIVTVQNAVELPIQALPDVWNGRNRDTTRCKNFQFAVQYFGYPVGTKPH